MKTNAQIRDTILRLATRAAGVSRREVRDSFHVPYREHVQAVLAAMLAASDVMEALRPSPNKPGRTMRRIFVERGAGQKWSAGLVVTPAKPKPQGIRPKRLERATKAIGPAPRPIVCEAGTDHRYTVHSLPPGYVSTLNPAECRPWANVAAQQRREAA